MRTLPGILAVIAILTTTCSSPLKNSSSDQPPNIIVILADDMGYSDIGCFGGEIETPNIDRLAAEGLKMTNFYNAARCCPSRAALLTGLYPHQAGVGDMSSDDSLPSYRGFLNKECITLAELLGENGYHCMISGKWHVGYPRNTWPMKRGFDRQYCSNGTTGHYFGVAEGRDYIIEDTLREIPGEWVDTGQTRYKPLKNEDGSQWYATDAYADRAIKYIRELREKNSEQPFFLYLPFTAPHWPLHAFEEDIQKYQGKYMAGWDVMRKQRYQRMKELGIISAEWELSPRNMYAKDWAQLDDSTRRYYDRLMAVYAAMVDRMDQNIGKVMQALEEMGDSDNTLVLFLSDNGGCHEAPHRGKPGALPGTPESFDGYEHSWANVSNTPFSWFKHWTHEGGSSTPLIAWYPKMIEGGRTDRQVAHIIDIMPTIADITGSVYPEQYAGHPILPTEGISLLPIFRGEKRKGHDLLYWQHEGNRAVRKGDWKIVSRYDYDNMKYFPWELYNIVKDRSETNDLAAVHPEMVVQMTGLYDQWADRVGVVPYGELREWRWENWQRKW